MDLTSLFQTVYTVCFILAGVLFATAVFVFFRFNILGVVESLSGIKMPGKKAGATKKGYATVSPAKAGKKAGKTEQVFSTATLTESKFVPEPEGSVGNTVWMDTRGTSCLGEEEEFTEIDIQTGEMESTTGTLDDADFVGGEEAAAKARETIHFMPERKIVVIHTQDRI